ncbi:MAG: hypothetical protein Q4C02_10300 [Eubacteriales bacterium]|nr:hypothetical protein [Eubacteriales bacterium]
MAVFLTVLKILGILLLVVLAAALLVFILVLFVPFRYSFSGRVDDPEGSSEVLHLDPKRDISLAGEIRWLAGILQIRAAYDGTGQLKATAFGFPLPVSRLLQRGKKTKEKKPEKPQEPKEEKSLEDRIEGILKRIEKLYARIDDALRVLGTDYGIRAKEKAVSRLLILLEKTLPAKWGLTGVLGLGEPARSAQVYAVQGYLYPVTAGHVALGTDFDLFRYDLQGAARGSVRIFPFVYTGLCLILDRDVRRLLRRLRRGPASHKKGNGTGNGHRFGKTTSA